MVSILVSLVEIMLMGSVFLNIEVDRLRIKHQWMMIVVHMDCRYMLATLTSHKKHLWQETFLALSQKETKKMPLFQHCVWLDFCRLWLRACKASMILCQHASKENTLPQSREHERWLKAFS